MKSNWRNLIDFMHFIVVRFDEDRCMQIASSLSFNTLLSLVPILTIALTILSAFPIFESFSIQIKDFLPANLVPDMSVKIIAQYMQQFTESAMNLTTVGIVFLALTAMMTLLTVDHAFNTIWRVSRTRPLLKRLLVYWAVLTLAPLLIGASLSLTSYLVGLSMGYIKHVPIIALNFLNILPILFTSLAFTLLFWLMPNRPMPLLHAVIGALVAAILFESMNSLFGYYIKHFNTYNLVYGAFASVPVFLMWIYLSWLITLLGAVVAASISHWHDTATDRLSSSIRLLNALRVLQYLSSGLQQGRPGTYREMSRSLHMGYDTLEEIINKLESGGMIIRTTGNGWMLMRDPSHIQVPDLLRLLVLDSDFLKTELMEDPLHLWVLSCIGQFEQGSDMSLQALFTRYTHDTSGEP